MYVDGQVKILLYVFSPCGPTTIGGTKIDAGPVSSSG
jgi:hypothetical protein